MPLARNLIKKLVAINSEDIRSFLLSRQQRMRVMKAGLCSIATLASYLARVRSFSAFAAAGSGSGFKTLAEAATYEQIVKKSKFVAHAQSGNRAVEAMC
jgi:hypothetical protein